MSATFAGLDERRAASRGLQATLIDRRCSLRLAPGGAELEAVLRFRFEVFNLELHEGFAESFFTGNGRR